MKLFKKLAILCTALTLCVGVGATVASCGGDKGGDVTSEATQEGYNFKVLKKDGTPAAGYQVQLCLAGDAASCFMPVDVEEDGTVFYAVDKTKEYEIHLMLNGEQVSKLNFQTLSKIPANYDGGVIEIKLTK